MEKVTSQEEGAAGVFSVTSGSRSCQAGECPCGHISSPGLLPAAFLCPSVDREQVRPQLASSVTGHCLLADGRPLDSGVCACGGRAMGWHSGLAPVTDAAPSGAAGPAAGGVTRLWGQ
jgi:hypothetical protein